MSRLRRLVVFDRYFFVTCNLLRARRRLHAGDFEVLARVIRERREEHGFLLTTWVFLPDHWHAIIGVRHPQSISLVMESIKVGSTRRINTRRGDSGILWQGRFFDRALGTVKEYTEKVEYIHQNPVRRGLVTRPEEWDWSSAREYAIEKAVVAQANMHLRIDRVNIPADPRARL